MTLFYYSIGNPNGKAQAIVPCDMNLILDDDLADMFGRVKHGVIFTLVAGINYYI